MPKKNFFQKTSPGLSILLSVVMISAVVVFSIGVTTMVTDSTRQAANVKQSTTAYYSAEAALEQALWVNHSLTAAGSAQGAQATGSTGPLANNQPAGNFKIQGLADSTFLDPTINGTYIQPFPWTGNVPWHGEGSKPVVGGCDPQKPPLTSGGTFSYPNPTQGQPPLSPNTLDHPCNWGKLAVGEKVTIPLFGVDKNGGNIVNFDNFQVRLRTPCKDGQEYCLNTDRLLLNCFDKGSGEKRCSALTTDYNKDRGEVVLVWQIAATKAAGSTITINPLEHIQSTGYYYSDDSQIHEGKIAETAKSQDFLILNSTIDQGTDINTKLSEKIQDFITSLPFDSKVSLSLSVVLNLVGCQGQTSCNNNNDNPAKSNYNTPHLLPYLEYQIKLLGANSSNPPASKDNIVTSEGQSGPFTQTIQVRAPIDNSSLEYVIQQ